jgi:hypothetical protein
MGFGTHSMSSSVTRYGLASSVYQGDLQNKTVQEGAGNFQGFLVVHTG